MQKNLVLSQPLGDVGLTHRVHLWFDGKRIVDFLLAIIELYSLALMADELLSEICRNRPFLNWWVTLSANFNFGSRSNCCYCANRAQMSAKASCHPSPQHLAQNVPNFFEIGSLSAEL